MGAAHTTNTNSHMAVIEILLRQSTCFLRKRGREEHVAVIRILIVVCDRVSSENRSRVGKLTASRQDLLHVIHPVRANKLVSFVDDGILDAT